MRWAKLLVLVPVVSLAVGVAEAAAGQKSPVSCFTGTSWCIQSPASPVKLGSTYQVDLYYTNNLGVPVDVFASGGTDTSPARNLKPGATGKFQVKLTAQESGCREVIGDVFSYDAAGMPTVFIPTEQLQTDVCVDVT